MGKKRAAKARKAAYDRKSRDTAYNEILANRAQMDNESPQPQTCSRKGSARSTLDGPIRYSRTTKTAKLRRPGPIGTARTTNRIRILKVGAAAGGRWQVSKRVWLDLYIKHVTSARWATRQRRYLERHGKACGHCGETKAVAVQHLSYIRFTEERDSDLMAICGQCKTLIKRQHRADGADLYAVSQDLLEEFSVSKTAWITRLNP